MLRLNMCYSYARARKMIKRRRFSIKDGIYIFVIFLLIGNLSTNVSKLVPQSNITSIVHAQSISLAPQVIAVNEADKRVAKLKSFLDTNNSPLAPYSQEIITDSDQNALDWTKIVAISGIESHYCTLNPIGSFNCWGLGGDNFMYFNSYPEAIKFVTNLLGAHYKQDEFQGIKNKYCPQSDNCNPAWASIVTEKSNEILQTEGR